MPGVPPWLGRTIATSILVFGFTIGVFWYGLSPRTRILRASGKLSQANYDDVRPTVERNIRILIVLFGAFACFYLTVPLSVDLVRFVGGEEPPRISGTVRDRSVPLFGVWFIEQSVSLSKGKGDKYQLYYSWKPLYVGKAYEFVVLPRSRVIIEFHESQPEGIRVPGGGWPGLLISQAQPTPWVPRSFAYFAKGRVPRTPTAAKLRHPIPKRNLPPALIHAHRPGFVQKIETVAAPPPLLGCVDQPSLHRIAMHIPEHHRLHPIKSTPPPSDIQPCAHPKFIP